MAGLAVFLKQYNPLNGVSGFSTKAPNARRERLLARIDVSDTLSITTNANLQNQRKCRFNGDGRQGRLACAADGRWRLPG
jgi:hypothetical protein